MEVLKFLPSVGVVLENIGVIVDPHTELVLVAILGKLSLFEEDEALVKVGVDLSEVGEGLFEGLRWA